MIGSGTEEYMPSEEGMPLEDGMPLGGMKPGRADEEKEQKKSPMREFLEMVAYTAFVVLAAFFLYTYVAQQVEVEGHSMMDTLNDGQHLILEKLSYRFGEPKRFDIIVFRPYADEKDTYYIKRVIGLPGETIQIIGADIYVDGERIEEDYGLEEMGDPGLAKEPLTLGEEEYFVLGDNRNNSMDSRDSRVGNVSRDTIMGRAWVRIWPLNKIGILSHQ